MPDHHTAPASFDPASIKRPARPLWTYYILCSILTGPGIVFMLPFLYFRFHTMKYRFDDEGVSMSWGILFRREVNLTYRRIQDIHLTSNIIERWMGLSKLAVQTASGSSTPEMTIEGVLEAEALRNYLYTKMRGARGEVEPAKDAAHAPEETDESLALLRDIRDEVMALRTKLEARP